jgi:hypothetical protein
MIYKGIEFSVVQGIEPDDWKWSVSIGNSAKIGQAKSKPDAVIAAWRTIDRALQRNKQGFTVPGSVAGQTKKMTGDQSRYLKVGDRIQWDNSLTDRGTISEVDWRGVTIKWDDGRTNTIYHNDMAQIERVPMKLE